MQLSQILLRLQHQAPLFITYQKYLKGEGDMLDE